MPSDTDRLIEQAAPPPTDPARPRKRRRLWRILIFTGVAIVALIAIVAGGGALAIHFYGRELPDHNQLAAYDPSIVTRVHAGDGRLLAEYAIEKRVFVPLTAMPKLLVSAFLAAEDKNFFAHFGVDPMSVVSALFKNIANLGGDRRLVGASTITQQVAKNFLLTNELSFARKIKEAILAVRIERTYTKERILELYMNQIYLGGGSYGVAAAALDYFDKSLDELSIAEAAYLAALPKAPNNYHPIRHKDAAISRRNWVLGQMVENSVITRAEADQAMAEPLTVRARGETEVVRADYFAEEARRWLAARFGEEQLYRGGLAVHTTLDPKLQAIAERAFRNGLVAYDRRHGWRGPVASITFEEANWQTALAAQQKPSSAAPEWQLALVLKIDGKQAEIGVSDGKTGHIRLDDLAWARFVKPGLKMGPPVKKVADVLNPGDVILVEPKADKPERYTLRQVPEVSGGMVVMDPHNGRVLAMVGGLSYKKSEFNRATQANRQPGSAFKPFIYLAALDNGYTPSTIVMDESIELPQGPGLPLWKPENYSEDFHGPSTLRYGIEHSRNLMTVRIANNIGMDIIADYTKRFGINDNLPKYLSSSLGSIETTVLRLTAAYAMVVNGGKKIEPAFIERIQDKTGATVYRRDTRVCEGCRVEQFDSRPPPVLPDNREVVADPITTYQIVSMLEGVVKRGTATTVSTLGIPLAGKTGTTNDFRDAWFVGFSPDLVVGTYVGFDQPRNLGKKETGGKVAAPVFREFMAEAMKGHPAVPFRVPNGVKFFRVNLETGAPAAPGDEKVILEAFRPGTSPATATIAVDGEGVVSGQDPGSTDGTPDGQDDDVEGLY